MAKAYEKGLAKGRAETLSTSELRVPNPASDTNIYPEPQWNKEFRPKPVRDLTPEDFKPMTAYATIKQTRGKEVADAFKILLESQQKFWELYKKDSDWESGTPTRGSELYADINLVHQICLYYLNPVIVEMAHKHEAV